MTAIQDLTVGEIVGWAMSIAAVIAFVWKGLPLVRKTSRFIDAMTGYTDPAGTRHPGLVEQVAELIAAVRDLKASVRAAPTRADIDRLDALIRRYHPEDT